MTEYQHIGDAVGDALAHNAAMAARHAVARAEEDARRAAAATPTPKVADTPEEEA